MATPSFAVHADEFVAALNQAMTKFGGVPNEDLFSAILQIARDALVGDNFLRMSQGGLDSPIAEVLNIAAQEGDLTLEHYDLALDTMMKVGLATWRD
ncbi:MAG: hypothetical protein IMZ62_11985 [Chloroflexi bacterium]|nr:hypothetical protein [Chloroflexota bacterium]